MAVHAMVSHQSRNRITRQEEAVWCLFLCVTTIPSIGATQGDQCDFEGYYRASRSLFIQGIISDPVCAINCTRQPSKLNVRNGEKRRHGTQADIQTSAIKCKKFHIGI